MTDKPTNPGPRPAEADPETQHAWLAKALLWHNHLYYEAAEPEISDADYDRLMRYRGAQP